MQRENIVIPLSGYFSLNPGLPWSIGLVREINRKLYRQGAIANFIPPRFIGFFVQDGYPIAVAGTSIVALDRDQLPKLRLARLAELTMGLYTIVAEGNEKPDFILIFDRCDGTCHLWSFPHGMILVQSTEPVVTPYSQ